MATALEVRQGVREIEGFDVMVVSRDGVVMRDDAEIGDDYCVFVQRPSQDRTTAYRWSRNRFRRFYPNYDVIVLLPDGNQVGGNTLLGTVRSRYPDPLQFEKTVANVVRTGVEVLWRVLFK